MIVDFVVNTPRLESVLEWAWVLFLAETTFCDHIPCHSLRTGFSYWCALYPLADLEALWSQGSL